MRVTPLALLACVIGGALAGATYDRIPGTALDNERLGRDLVRASLPDDPDAPFRNVRSHASARDGAPLVRVCGEVDSQSLSGPRRVFRRFVADLAAKSVRFEPEVTASPADVAAKLAECRAFQVSGWNEIARQCDHDAASLSDEAGREAEFDAAWTAACAARPTATTIAGG